MARGSSEVIGPDIIMTNGVLWLLGHVYFRIGDKPLTRLSRDLTHIVYPNHHEIR